MDLSDAQLELRIVNISWSDCRSQGGDCGGKKPFAAQRPFAFCLRAYRGELAIDAS